ncbi:tetratricopeptide repeat protein [Micromonospora maritima]|uniref:tetratricopeptide repeat protein n=1 Tax=Micromonospora maritima TaxID=986711 RepID=UPI003795085A
MSWHPMVQQADSLIQLGRYDQAGQLLARRLADEPDDAHALFHLARCHRAAGDHRQALTALDEALARDPENLNALVMRAQVLRGADHLDRAQRWGQAEESLRTALRLAPHNCAVHAALAELLAYVPARRAEAVQQAREAIRLDPESVRGYEALWLATTSDDVVTAQWALHEVLRIDPENKRALLLVTEQRASRPGTGAQQATELYGDALAVAPDVPGLRWGLDRSTYRLLRGIRWLALICLAAAAVTVDLFVTDGETARDLPVPLGNRVWTLAAMAAVWGFGAWLRYRRLRAGVRMNVRSLVRRHTWARIVLAQAVVAMLCAVLISQVPWTTRTLPQVLFWTGLASILATIWFDRRRVPDLPGPPTAQPGS